ncbi:MAG: flavin reductase family protein [Clostridia bacterium]|nr:flavin reductase family protein [Clostridia bacterium]
MKLKKGIIQRAFTYFESGATLLVTTNDGKRKNVMTISWQMVMDFTPRIAITTGAWNESHDTLLKTKECCLCIPAFDLLDTVVGVGTIHGSECDKFEHFGLKTEKAAKVKAPIITNCIAALECKLEDYIEHHGIFVFKGIGLWENEEKEERRIIHANGDGTFFADGEFRNLRDEMRQWVPEGSERY